MNNLDKILQQVEYAALHPGQMVHDWKQSTGGKAVGWLPIHCPREIVHAAGMLPVGLWGGAVTINKAGEYLQAFCCSVMKAVMELALNGAYRELDAIISPNTCDTMRCIPLMLKLAVPHPPVVGLVLPDHRKIEAGIQYTAQEYRHLAQELQVICGTKVTDAALEQSIDLYNRHGQLMREFLKTSQDHLNVITPYYRHMILKSSLFVPVERHMRWLEELLDELRKAPVCNWPGVRVVLTGIMAEPYELLKIMEEFNIAVVGDDLAQGSRQFRTPTPAGTDPYVRLAQRFAELEGCSCVADPYKLRGSLLVKLREQTQADGVVVLMMKFCDPEEYDYPYLVSDLENAGVPHVYVESEQQMESLQQARTRLQAFGEMVGRN